MKKKLLVIASYPPKGTVHHKLLVGVASYTKNTLTSFPQNVGITVFAEKLEGEKNYTQGKVNVKRVWERGSFLILISLFLKVLGRKEKDVFIAFELAMFEGVLSIIALPFFIAILRVWGKKVFFVCHHVVLDFKSLYGHLDMKKNDPRLLILNLMAKIFYTLIIFLSTKVIVFDEFLRKSLSSLGDDNKIEVIPHGIEKFKLIAKENARKKLALSKKKIILYFGFLSWYKGTDWLIKNFRKTSKTDLVIAGGPNPNHLKKKFYRNYIESQEEECKKRKILLIGFVPEEKIPLYFAAADVAIFPYRSLFSASGPLSMAFSFQKPFFVSKPLTESFKTEDINKATNELKINQKSLTFELDNSFNKKIHVFLNNNDLQKKLKMLGFTLAKERSWKKIGRLYYEAIFNN